MTGKAGKSPLHLAKIDLLTASACRRWMVSAMKNLDTPSSTLPQLWTPELSITSDTWRDIGGLCMSCVRPAAGSSL